MDLIKINTEFWWGNPNVENLEDGGLDESTILKWI
jgi:hypothetical protein